MIRGFLLAFLLLAPVPAVASDITRSTLAAAATTFDMSSRDTGADHRIHVFIPPETRPDARLPVVYLLDADGHFPLFTEIVRVLIDAGDIPPVAVVGIGYPVQSMADTITGWRPKGRHGSDRACEGHAGDSPNQLKVRELGHGSTLRLWATGAVIAGAFAGLQSHDELCGGYRRSVPHNHLFCRVLARLDYLGVA